MYLFQHGLYICLLLGFGTSSAFGDVDGEAYRTIRGIEIMGEDNQPKNMNISELRILWKNIEMKVRQVVKQGVGNLMPLMVNVVNNSQLNVSANCSVDVIRTVEALAKAEYWAFKMLDAFGKFPSGVLEGNVNFLGNYDECVNTDVSGSFSGMFCGVEIVLPTPKTGPYYSSNKTIVRAKQYTDPDWLVKNVLQSMEPYLYWFVFFTTVCVPSTCTREDVENIVRFALKEKSLDAGAKVISCSTRQESYDITSIDVICMVLLVSVILLFVTGTLLEICLLKKEENSNKEHGVIIRVLLCFSGYTNSKLLMMTESKPGHVTIFNGMKVITMLWVILNHTYNFIPMTVLDSVRYPIAITQDLPFQFIINGYFAVETFFFISAVLSSYTKAYNRGGLLKIALYRIYRLLPPMIFVICLAILSRFVGSGPLWKESVGLMSYQCRQFWWKNLIMINNFSDFDKQCMGWTWYVTVDLHLFIMSVVFIAPFIKKGPRFCLMITGILLAVGIIGLAVNHIVYNLPPAIIMSTVWYPADVLYYLRTGYFSTLNHIIVYAIGLAVGFIVHMKRKIHIPIPVNVLGYALAFGMSLTVVYGVYGWNLVDSHEPSLAVSVLYAVTGKVIYATSLAWITITCVTCNAGLINSLLSMNFFQALARITYMTYLIHPIFQILYAGSVRVQIEAQHRTMVLMYLGYVLASFLVGFVASLLFEAPFSALGQIIFERKKASDIPSNALSENGNSDNNLKNLN